MPAPNLDRRITIQSAIETQDASGQPIQTWSDLAADEPAEYLPVSGMERFAARQYQAIAVARFRIRYRTDITRKMRLVYEGETYDITAAEEDRRFDRRQYLLITAEAKPE